MGVCQAVQHAHHNGVIYPDPTPGNVLVASHDGTPVAKVIDIRRRQGHRPAADGTRSG